MMITLKIMQISVEMSILLSACRLQMFYLASFYVSVMWSCIRVCCSVEAGLAVRGIHQSNLITSFSHRYPINTIHEFRAALLLHCQVTALIGLSSVNRPLLLISPLSSKTNIQVSNSAWVCLIVPGILPYMVSQCSFSSHTSHLVLCECCNLSSVIVRCPW